MVAAKEAEGRGGTMQNAGGPQQGQTYRIICSQPATLIILLISDELTVHTDEPPCDHGEVAEMHPLTYERRSHSVHGTVAFPGQSIHSQDRIDYARRWACAAM